MEVIRNPSGNPNTMRLMGARITESRPTSQDTSNPDPYIREQDSWDNWKCFVILKKKKKKPQGHIYLFTQRVFNGMGLMRI